MSWLLTLGRPVVKFVERRDTPCFCLVKLIIGLAWHDRAFASDWIQDPSDLWKIKIPRRLNAVPIEWATEWKDVPVLRRAVRNATGNIVTSPKLACQFSQMASWNRRLGMAFGMPERFDFKVLRRMAGAALNSESPLRQSHTQLD